MTILIYYKITVKLIYYNIIVNIIMSYSNTCIVNVYSICHNFVQILS